MARPRKNNADYFSHDKDMRNDPRIRSLRRKYSHEGYAAYNYLLELLTDSDNFRHDWNEMSIEIMAGDFDMDPQTLICIVDYMVEKLALFTMQEGAIWNETLIKRFQPLISKRDRDAARYSPQETPTKAVPASEKPKAEVIPVAEKPEAKPPKPKKTQPDALQIPFMTAEFISAWKDLIALPKWKKKPPSALQASLNQLSKYNEKFAIRLIDKAIAGNYQGVVFSNTDEEFQKYIQSPAPGKNGKVIINTPVKEIEGWK